MDVVRIITELRAKHAEKGNSVYGIDGNKKKIADMVEMNIWEPVAVKNQVLKTAIEASCLLLRIDDVVSGVKRKEKQSPQQNAPVDPSEMAETFGDARDGWLYNCLYDYSKSKELPFIFLKSVININITIGL